jgi:hypothetical protein
MLSDYVRNSSKENADRVVGRDARIADQVLKNGLNKQMNLCCIKFKQKQNEKIILIQ